MKKRQPIYDSKDNDTVRKYLLSQRYAIMAAIIAWILVLFALYLPNFEDKTRLFLQIMLSIALFVLAWPYIQEQKGVQIYNDMIVVAGRKVLFKEIVRASYNSKTMKIQFLRKGKTKSYSLGVNALPPLPELKEIFGEKLVEEK